MFDIGFPELLIVSVVALLVLGPERLPVALRTLGLWFGRMRRSFAAVKIEIEREIGMDEVRRQLHNEAILDEMRSLESDVNSIGKEVSEHTTGSLDTTANDLETAMNENDLETAESGLDKDESGLDKDESGLETAQSGLDKSQSDLDTTPSAWTADEHNQDDPHFEEGEAELEEPRNFDSDDFQYSNEPHPNDNRGN